MDNDAYIIASEMWHNCKYAKKDQGFACSKLNCRIMLKCCYRCEDFDEKEEENNGL